MLIESFTRLPGALRACEGTHPLDGPTTLVLLFGPSRLLDEPDSLRGLVANFPKSVVLGCSGAGAVAGPCVLDDAVSVAIARFDKTALRQASIRVGAMGESRATGRNLASAFPHPGLRAVFLLSDGLNVNGSELVAGMSEALPTGVVLSGGLAADDDRFVRTWVVHEGRPVSGMVTAVGLYGADLRIGTGYFGGWGIFGPERRVTRARDNVLHEIDGKPALSLYKTYLGDLAAGLPSTGLLFPLALRRDQQDEEPVVRTLLSVDEASQTMTFAGNIPEGSFARLMKANVDRLVDGAAEAARRAAAADSRAGAVLSVAISCVGRRLVLGERTEEELETTLEHLPPGTRQVGFYSYGEISPFGAGGCGLHNQTMTLTTFHEA